MSELVDFMLEREKRSAVPAIDRSEDQAVICYCGSARFWLLRDGTVECAKCLNKPQNVRWILNNA
jgi:hypothetical protein